MSKGKTCLLVVLYLLGLSSIVQAQQINVDFWRADSAPHSASGAAVIGAEGDQWNLFSSDDSGTTLIDIPLFDVSGIDTGITLTVNGNGHRFPPLASYPTPYGGGWYLQESRGTITAVFSGFSPGTEVNLYAYPGFYDPGIARRPSSVTVHGITLAAAMSDRDTLLAGTYIEGGPYTPDSDDPIPVNSNYVVFRNVIADENGQITATCAGGTSGNDYYDIAGMQIEILSSPFARGPFPLNNADDIERDNLTLTWKPGIGATHHDVYFGTDFNDVNDATIDSAGIYQGQFDEAIFELGRLPLGIQHFWRVDEVNENQPHQLWKGDVWNFTVEPEGYPVAVELLSATASSQSSPQGPESLVNGHGLDNAGNHSTRLDDMWLSQDSDPHEAWIQIDINHPVKLAGVHVWNHNSFTEQVDSLGIRKARIEYSLDGFVWDTFGVVEIAKAPGDESYQGMTIGLDGIVAKSVKITAISNWSVLGLRQYGLSEVQLLAVPTTVRDMKPEEGSAVSPIDALLSWRAGRQSARHDLYLSTDLQAVIDETAPVEMLLENAYVPNLLLDQTYYWKVNEVNSIEEPAVWEGSVQSFTTQASITVDNMESFRDAEGYRTYDRWEDGYFDDNNGSVIGYGDAGGTEKTVVFEGAHSLPMEYGMNNVQSSTATWTFSGDAEDWTAYGIKSLLLHVYGKPDNQLGTFYVLVNDTRYNYGGAAEDLKAGQWIPFSINLDGATVVRSLTLGMEGGAGMIFVDDIRLLPQESSKIHPMMPADTDLFAHYDLNGDFDDSSGNGLHGTPIQSPGFAQDAERGQVLSLNGLSSCVDLGPAGEPNEGFNFAGSFSVCAWININNWINSWGHSIVSCRGRTGGNYTGFNLRRHRDSPNLTFTVRGTDGADDPVGRFDVASKIGEWMQLTAIYDVESGQRILYVNGIVDIQIDDGGIMRAHSNNAYIGAASNDNNSDISGYFDGKIDDVRLYNRVLSQAEAMGLAARTSPLYRN